MLNDIICVFVGLFFFSCSSPLQCVLRYRHRHVLLGYCVIPVVFFAGQSHGNRFERNEQEDFYASERGSYIIAVYLKTCSNVPSACELNVYRSWSCFTAGQSSPAVKLTPSWTCWIAATRWAILKSGASHACVKCADPSHARVTGAGWGRPAQLIVFLLKFQN